MNIYIRKILRDSEPYVYYFALKARNEKILCAEASLQRCSHKKMFWKYATNLQANPHAEVWSVITPRHGCSLVNSLHIFRTPFSKNTSGWLFLHVHEYFLSSFIENLHKNVLIAEGSCVKVSYMKNAFWGNLCNNNIKYFLWIQFFFSGIWWL